MMFEIDKYNVDPEKLFKDQFPYFFRENPETGEDREKFLAFLDILASMFNNVADSFLELAQEKQEFLKWRNQHLSIQSLLNEKFDSSLKRITITENNVVGIGGEIWYRWGENDPQPKTWYRWGEIDPQPKTFNTWIDFISSGFNFTINIPLSLKTDTIEGEITRLLYKYITIRKTFNFNYF